MGSTTDDTEDWDADEEVFEDEEVAAAPSHRPSSPGGHHDRTLSGVGIGCGTTVATAVAIVVVSLVATFILGLMNPHASDVGQGTGIVCCMVIPITLLPGLIAAVRPRVGIGLGVLIVHLFIGLYVVSFVYDFLF